MFQFLTHLFVSQNADGDKYLTMLGYLSLLLLLLIVMFLIPSFQKQSKSFKTKQLVFSSASIALAMVLSFVKPFSLPFGGSITFFSMFFISYIGSLYGLKAGLMSGFAYGILQFITGPYIYHPVQVLLDYPLAFGCLGLSGLFYINNSKKLGNKISIIKRCTLGFTVGVIGRYLCHVASGYIFFSEYAGDTHPVLYSFTYNATYIVPELLLTILILLLPPVTKLLIELQKIAVEE